MQPVNVPIPDDLPGRNQILMERCKILGDAVYSDPMGLVIRPNVDASKVDRWGFDAVQSSAWYAVSLARWCKDHPDNGAEERRKLNRLLCAMCAQQDRKSDSATYGNIVWRWGWEDVKDRNGVSFWSPEAGYIYTNHRDLLDKETERALTETLALCVEGLDRHRPRWQYTNIFLLNILSRLTIARALDRQDVLEQAEEDWQTWFTETDRGGLTEYNSPTYIVTALAPLARMLDLTPDGGMRRQIETILGNLYADFCWHYHPETGLLAGAMSRAYSGDWLRNSLSNSLAYQQFGAPLMAVNLVSPFVALSNYQAPPECIRYATEPKAGVTVRAAIPDSRIRRLTHFGKRYALGVKSGPAYGPQELALTLAHPAKRQPLLFLRQQPETRAPLYAEMVENGLLCGLVFRDPPKYGGSPHNWAKLHVGYPDDFERIEINGVPWNGDYAAIVNDTHLRLVTSAITADFRFGFDPLNTSGSPAQCVAYLWHQYEHDHVMLDIVAWGPTLAALALSVTEDGPPQPPGRIARHGASISAVLPAGETTVTIPEDDRAPLPEEIPLLEAPGVVWRRGSWGR